MSRGRSLPNDFGREYRAALFALSPPTTALRLAWVLVDQAFATGSLTVVLGNRLVRELTGLHDGRSLEKGRDWLIAHGFVSVRSEARGRAGRTEWTLETTARSFPPHWNDRAGADILRSINVRSGADIQGRDK